jgi:RNA polymerase sigma-70 factor (ECF subfamily)
MNKLRQMESETLMQLYAASNRAAFEILYERYSRKILGYLLKKVKNKDLAEDLLQTFFHNLHKVRTTFNPQFKLEAWFFTMAHNLIASHYRQQVSEKKMLQSLEPAAMENTGEEGEVDFSAIREAMEKLPKNQRDAIALRYFHADSFQTIAQKLDKKEDNIRKLVSRALARLRELLGYEKI